MANRLCSSREKRRTSFHVLALTLAAALSLVVACSDGRSGEPSGASDLPRFLPTYLPPGATLTEVVEFPFGVDATPSGEALSFEDVVWVDDPDGDTAALVLRSATGLPPGTKVDPPIVTETDGYVVASTIGSAAGEDGYVVWAKGIDQAVVEDVLSNAVVGPEGVVSLTPPPGFQEVFRHAWQMSGYPPGTEHDSNSALIAASYEGYALQYWTTGPAPTLTVSRTPGAYAWHLAAVSGHLVSPTEVRGNPAYWWSTEHLDGILFGGSLLWWEEDVMVRVTALSEDDAVRIAEGLRQVDEEEWLAYAATAVPPPNGVTATTLSLRALPD